MNIILCNDDGIDSNGLIVLAENLSKNNRVLVVAPDGNRSGASHSLTLNTPLKIQKVDLSKNFIAYKTSGTPVDCVKIAKLLFKEFKADIVVSGINKAHNLGTDINYSGTVAIAAEASFFSDISFAFSAFNHGESDFNLLSKHAISIIDKLIPYSSKGVFWNINFPNIDKEIKGIKIVPLGKHLYTDRYERIGKDTFKLVGELIDCAENISDCDVELIKQGYITITPLCFDRTDYNKLSSLKDFEINL